MHPSLGDRGVSGQTQRVGIVDDEAHVGVGLGFGFLGPDLVGQALSC